MLDQTLRSENMQGVASQSFMPPHTPLAFPVQSLSDDYRGPVAPKGHKTPRVFARSFVFLMAGATTAYVVSTLMAWFSDAGLSVLELFILSLISMTFFWVALSVSTASLGMLSFMRPASSFVSGASQRDKKMVTTALLLPIYNEDPVCVLGNASAMMQALKEQGAAKSHSLFVLSDTTDPLIAQKEEQAFLLLRQRLGSDKKIYYRRRENNTDYKTGNIAQWVQNWGGAYDAMIVLDADSLMSAQTIITLSRELASRPSVGLIQSFPLLIGAQSIFGRVQQFSSRIYGSALAEGLAWWTGREGNFWGHNAIMRTQAFSASAGLPKITSLSGHKTVILSHDFIEAALLRRAGWGVEFLPRVGGSYEEVPQTLVDYIIRDRRWCKGNLQHLRLLPSRGFHLASRFHMLAGAMGYLMSPMWLMLLLIWAGLGTSAGQTTFHYFSGYNPQVSWPSMSTPHHAVLLVFMYSMLLAPKVMGLVSLGQSGIRANMLGGRIQLIVSFTTEVVFSILYAPILMVQQTVAVLRVVSGVALKWQPQKRDSQGYSFNVLLRFHWLETALGILLTYGMLSGIMSLWLVPIALSLVLAIPLSALGAFTLAKTGWQHQQMATPEHISPPQIWRDAQSERAVFYSSIHSRGTQVENCKRHNLQTEQNVYMTYATTTEGREAVL